MNIEGYARTVLAMIRANIQAARDGLGRRAYLVPLGLSDPGIGKTEVMEWIAGQLGNEGADVFCQNDQAARWGFINADLQTRDPADLGGQPWVVDGHSVRCRPDWLPDTGMGILSLDELAQACLPNLNIASMLVRDGRIGEWGIGTGWMITAASNFQHNRAGTTTLPTQLRNRLIPLKVDADAETWGRWAAAHGIDPLTIAYNLKRREYHHKFSATDDAYPSGRRWAMASRVQTMDLPPELMTECLCGTVGNAAATDFEAFKSAHAQLPDIEEILNSPKIARLPEGTDIAFVVMSILAHRAKPTNFGNIVEYLLRMDEQEFGMTCVADATNRDPQLKMTSAYTRWSAATGNAINQSIAA